MTTDRPATIPAGGAGVPLTILLGLPGAGQGAVLDHLRDHPGARTVYTVGADETMTETVGDPAGGVTVVLDAAGLEGPDAVVALAHDILPEQGYVANLVTVVGVPGFAAEYARTVDRVGDDGAVTAVPLAAVLVEQIEGADVVLLTGADEAGAAAAAAVEGYVRNLNPSAEVRRVAAGIVDADWLLGSDRYGAAPAGTPPAPGAAEDAWGFNSFVYAPARPFRWAAFAAAMEDWPDEVMRSRGFAVFSDHPPVLLGMVRDTVELTVLDGAGDDAGGHDHDGHEGHDHGGHNHDHDHRAEGDEDMEGTELVFIGRGMPAAEIVARLDGCLAPEGEPAVL